VQLSCRCGPTHEPMIKNFQISTVGVTGTICFHFHIVHCSCTGSFTDNLTVDFPQHTHRREYSLLVFYATSCFNVYNKTLGENKLRGKYLGMQQNVYKLSRKTNVHRFFFWYRAFYRQTHCGCLPAFPTAIRAVWFVQIFRSGQTLSFYCKHIKATKVWLSIKHR
jgi:hypothetical protein